MIVSWYNAKAMTMVLDEKKQLKDITLQELDKILTSTTEAITKAKERE